MTDLIQFAMSGLGITGPKGTPRALSLVVVAGLAFACSGATRHNANDGDECTATSSVAGGSEAARPDGAVARSSASTDVGAACDPSHWRVTASSSAQDESPANAVDGLPATRWSTAMGQGPGQYLQLDFGAWLRVSRLALVSGGSAVADYLRGYELQASQDGVTFNTLLASGTQPLPPPGGVQIIDFFPTSLRALRINSIQPSGNRWSVHELNLDCYGTDSRYADALRCDPNAPAAGAAENTRTLQDHRGWSASAARSADLHALNAAFDGDLATSWSTGAPQTSTDWFELDLGAVSCIGSVEMVEPPGEAANAFTVELSTDAVSYVQIAEGLGEDVAAIRFAPHSARFIRINQVGSGASNRWSIRELQVQP